MRSVDRDAVNYRYPEIVEEVLDLARWRSAAEQQAARHRGLPGAAEVRAPLRRATPPA
jgi:hypothetical protein